MLIRISLSNQFKNYNFQTTIMESKYLLLLCIGFAFLFSVCHSCDCDYHSGGCTISKGASKDGETCKCVYKGAWTCTGYDVGCSASQASICKAGCRSRDCCNAGGGDCGGY
nr:keratin-associated protein 5-5-like [Hydra vulgaris]